MQQHGVDDAENCRCSADPQSDRQHGNGGEPRRLPEHAQAVTHVLPEMLPPQPASRFVKALFGVHDVPEGTPRTRSGPFFAQPLPAQALDLKLYVRLDFRGEVVEFALAPEHGFSLPPPPLQESARWLPSIVSICWFL